MSNLAESSFEVTGWDQKPEDSPKDGPTFSRATVKKKFTGDLTGESVAELQMCQADPKDLTAGAGYIAAECVTGSIEGRKGTFVMHHWGISGDGSERTGGHIVPGSGTGALEGITGEITIEVDGQGAHTLTLNYEIP